MSDFYGSHFEFSGISSRQYGLIIANVETSRLTQSAGAISGSTIFSKSAKKLYLIDNDYSDSPLSFDIEIITYNGRCLNYSERRNIEKWLFNRREYRKLYLDVADDYYGETYEFVDGVRKRNYLNCRFINPSKLEYNGGIVGYVVTLEADSCMFWQDEIEKTFEINNKSKDTTSNITLNIDTDIDDYTYPDVKITMGKIGGDFIIINHRDDGSRMTKFVDISPFDDIIMKSSLSYVDEKYYGRFYYRNFIRLLDGKNNFAITGNVDSITFKYSQRRML